jgi:tetratricopeptide (TPR) repeat protein
MELTIEQALLQGVAAHKEGKLEDAERLYRAILQSQPEHADANHNLGVMAVSVNKADAALPLFKTALEANPKIEQFWLSYIDALTKEKQFENAKKAFERCKRQGVSGETLNILEKLIVPKTQTENVKSVSPSQQHLNSLIGYYQTGRYGDAEKLAVSITQEFPKHQSGWKILGAILKQTGRVSESLIVNQISLQLAPQDAKSHNNLGLTLQELGRVNEAKESYRKSITLNSDYAEAHSNLGTMLEEIGKLDEAEPSYRQAIALKPEFPDAHYNLGNTLQKLGRLDKAEASNRQAIALKFDYAEAHNNLGVTLKSAR